MAMDAAVAGHHDTGTAPLFLGTVAEVRASAESLRKHPVRMPGRVVVDLPALDDAPDVTTRVNALLGECGCTSGQLWLTAAAIPLVLLALPGPGAVPLAGVAQAAGCAGWLATAAGAGKAVGIRRARSRAADLLFDAAARAVEADGA